MEFLFLLLLIVPIFFVMGVVYFLKLIFGHDAPRSPFNDRITFLKKAIEELSKLSNNPNKKISELLSDYKDELKRLTSDSEQENVATTPSSSVASSKSSSKTLDEDISNFWNNWYSNNSINLLLYIGAFLIVASASIFVGFQWETIAGIFKALLLVILTLAFFGFGFWFYSLPKIKNAGATFIGIGALLIPVVGVAWYNFVVKDVGGSFGIVWLITSLISISVYFFLALRIRQSFYAYTTSIMTLSCSLSFVNVFSLNQNFYILASIVTSFILLVISFYSKKLHQKESELFEKPFEISSNILMPLTLIYGFAVASFDNLLFSLEAALSMFLASFYYFTSYFMTQKPWNLAVGELLYPLGLTIFFRWQGFENILLYYLVALLSLGDIVLAKIFTTSKLKDEADISITIGLIKIFFVFVVAVFSSVIPLHIFYLSLFPLVAGILVFYIKKQVQFLGISSLFLAVSTFIFTRQVIIPGVDLYVLSFIYLFYAIIFYMILYQYKSKEDYISFLSGSTVLFLFLSLITGFEHNWNLLVVNISIAIISITAAIVFKKEELQYIAHGFLYFAIFNMLSYFQIESTLYPFAFAVLSYMFYGVGTVMPDNLSKSYRLTGLVGSVFTPFVYGLTSSSFFYSNYYSTNNPVERNALITAYGAVLLYGIDIVVMKNPRMGYFTSALGMLTYLWQIKVLGIHESQWYTLPIGVYFMTLAYIRRIKGDTNTNETLNFIGLFFLLIPTFFQSFGLNGGIYTFLLIFMGIVLIAIGIGIKEKLYQYAGIGAIVLVVLVRTYEYLLALPKWLVIGLIGFLFLAVAIYLLSKRKE